MMFREFCISSQTGNHIDNSIDCPNCGWNWVRHKIKPGRLILCPALPAF